MEEEEEEEEKKKKKKKKKRAPVRLFTLRDAIHKRQKAKRCIILTIIIVISPHRNVSALVDTCRCFASSPLKPTGQ
ncbi:hypothetical protein F2P81_007832 [Scophthalmus maximus]|uniref:Uncharacterized protein n=1 Tax=Scophthalmus maximus TaxID=52904 RepID=A0A6A4T0P1_SCOMX|nr:hypothetical protein F2P81_007832 [Scophthalmus maximus]